MFLTRIFRLKKGRKWKVLFTSTYIMFTWDCVLFASYFWRSTCLHVCIDCIHSWHYSQVSVKLADANLDELLTCRRPLSSAVMSTDKQTNTHFSIVLAGFQHWRWWCTRSKLSFTWFSCAASCHRHYKCGHLVVKGADRQGSFLPVASLVRLAMMVEGCLLAPFFFPSQSSYVIVADAGAPGLFTLFLSFLV